MVFTSVINEIFPKYAYLQFQTKGGSFTHDAYDLDLSLANTIGIALIIAGLILAAYCFFSEKNDK